MAFFQDRSGEREVSFLYTTTQKLLRWSGVFISFAVAEIDGMTETSDGLCPS